MTDGKRMSDDALSLQASKSSLGTVLHYSSRSSCAVRPRVGCPLPSTRESYEGGGVSRGVEGCGRKTACAVVVPVNLVPHLEQGSLAFYFLAEEEQAEITRDTFSQCEK